MENQAQGKPALQQPGMDAVLAVLQTTQLDHERRIANGEARLERMQEYLQNQFDAVRADVTGKYDKMTDKIDVSVSRIYNILLLTAGSAIVSLLGTITMIGLKLGGH